MKGHWFWGCALDLAAERSQFLLAGHEEYGDVFISRALVRDIMFVFLGNGLVPNDGESWKRQHKLIMPGFHKKRVDAYAPTMVDFTERMLARWQEGERRDMRLELNALALEVVADTLFDIDIGAGDSETIRGALADISKILVTDADKEEIIRRVHEERRTYKTDRGDLFSHMVFVEDEQGGMSDKQLRDEAMTLIFAGHETTAHALTWTWYLLAKNPDKVAKMGEELGRVLNGRRAEVEDLPNLPYLEMVVKESLRLLPSVWAYARQAQRDLVIEGYEIKKGQTITISHIAAGRNAKYYDNPLELRPERWTREFERSLPRGAYTPFAGGPRVCLGQQFAKMEMRMILATLLQRVEPNLAAGFEPDFVTELSMHPGECTFGKIPARHRGTNDSLGGRTIRASPGRRALSCRHQRAANERYSETSRMRMTPPREPR
ncbi:MAG: cytochrome P450 [Deltaproteobacteria bacterium]|nr:cytochrome P450 [Deltaproteobacteria bacterium]